MRTEGKSAKPKQKFAYIDNRRIQDKRKRDAEEYPNVVTKRRQKYTEINQWGDEGRNQSVVVCVHHVIRKSISPQGKTAQTKNSTTKRRIMSERREDTQMVDRVFRQKERPRVEKKREVREVNQGEIMEGKYKQSRKHYKMRTVKSKEDMTSLVIKKRHSTTERDEENIKDINIPTTNGDRNGDAFLNRTTTKQRRKKNEQPRQYRGNGGGRSERHWITIRETENNWGETRDSNNEWAKQRETVNRWPTVQETGQTDKRDMRKEWPKVKETEESWSEKKKSHNIFREDKEERLKTNIWRDERGGTENWSKEGEGRGRKARERERPDSHVLPDPAPKARIPGQTSGKGEKEEQSVVVNHSEVEQEVAVAVSEEGRVGDGRYTTSSEGNDNADETTRLQDSTTQHAPTTSLGGVVVTEGGTVVSMGLHQREEGTEGSDDHHDTEEHQSDLGLPDNTTVAPATNATARPQRPARPLIDTAGSVRIPCYVVIFLLGIVGNSLVIVTLLQNRKMRTVTNVFLLNLSISDLLLGVLCMPVTLVGSLLRDFIFGAVMCRLIPYFQAVSVSVSVWTLVAISLERYYAICQPLKSRGWQTRCHAYKIISLVWLLSLLGMSPIAGLSKMLIIGNTNRHKCREIWPGLYWERGFNMFLGVGLLLVPLVIMVVAYCSISMTLWHGMRLERETGQGTGQALISLTDLNGLAMVQENLRRKRQSRRHVSKISIRFRKIPAQVSRPCDHCGQQKVVTLDETVPPLISGSPSRNDYHGCHCSDHSPYYASRNSDSLIENGNYNQRLSKKQKRQPDFKHLRSTHLEKSIEAKKHVIRMLFVVVLEFFVCWTPIFIVNILYLYIPEQVYRTLGSFGISFLHLLSYVSSCCNPITYCFMNKKFLQAFRYAFGCRKKDARKDMRQNGTGASFRSHSNNALRLVECRREARETTV